MSKVNSVFTCDHQFSWPRRRQDGSHYQVCVLCGDQYSYDWQSMSRGVRITQESEIPRPKRSAWVPRARRIHISKPILCRQSGTSEWHAGTLDNISESGVSFECNQLLPEDTDIEMIFEMPQEISGQPSSRVFCHGYVSRSGFTKSGLVVLGVAVWGYSFLHEEKNT